MHPVAEYRAQVDALKAELAELRARLPAPPQAHGAERDPRLPADAPVGSHIDACGIARDGRGQQLGVPNLTQADYVARARADQAAYQAEEAARVAKAREGLDGGLWRDPCGIVRTQDGQVAGKAEIEARQVDAVRQQQSQDHRAWKISNRLPVHPVRVSLPVTRAADLADD